MQTLSKIFMLLEDIVIRIEPIIATALIITSFYAAKHGNYVEASFDLLLCVTLRQRVTE